jgi:hypothetical protein
MFLQFFDTRRCGRTASIRRQKRLPEHIDFALLHTAQHTISHPIPFQSNLLENKS